VTARVLLVALAATQTVTGAWALVWPQGFFEHLVRDAGAGLLVLAVAVLVLVTRDRVPVRAGWR